MRKLFTFLRRRPKLRGKGRVSDRFDPVYYLRRYPDLATFQSAAEASGHYRRHGREEGRYPNAMAEEEADYRQYLGESVEFNLIAYRALNPDLERLLSDDREFILHYIRHGRREGRRATFEARRDIGSRAPVWLHLFSASQFSTWASALRDPPESYDAALALFQDWGIGQIAPIHFDYQFDPEFYRQYYAIPTSFDDVAMYREWLEHGLESNHAPNEARLLQPFLSGRSFPASFDWHGYAQDIGLPPNTARATSLIRLFEWETQWSRALRFLRSDTESLELMGTVARRRLRNDRGDDVFAILEALETQREAWPPVLYRLRGEMELARGRADIACYAFACAIDGGDSTPQNLILATRAYIAAGHLDDAIELLRKMQSSDSEQLSIELVDRLYQKMSAEAHAILAAGTSAHKRAGVVLQDGLTRIAALIEEFALPRVSRAKDATHVALLGNEMLPQCTHYRIEQKQRLFDKAGIEFRRHAESDTDGFMADLSGARAAIFYRVTATPGVIRAILTARSMGIPTYYEVDDLLFCADSYPPPFSTYGDQISETTYRGLQFGVPLFRFALSLCDRAIASTPALLERMTPLVREQHGLLIRNGLDERNTAMATLGRADRPRHDGRVRIFYGSGTLAHHADYLELVAPTLDRLMRENDRVDLVLVGHVPEDPILASYKGRVLRYPIVADIHDYWAILANCDINIAMLKPDAAGDCKSEIKWLEAAVFGIPTVASGTRTFRETISHGTDGLIADTPDQWHECMTELISDRSCRLAIGQAARAKALDEYALERGADALKAEFDEPRVSKSGSLRVLICNVFFYPQSFGGATRVVEDNVAAIAATCPNIELAVFCCDNDTANAGVLSRSLFGNVPVFRFGANGVDTDLLPFDPASAAAFRNTVQLFKPDLVHFHCVQQLSASIVRACLDLNIPYLVTLHDAWWISPHQFLIDEHGFLQMPSHDPLTLAADGLSCSYRELYRSTILASLLLGAKQILTVSPSFAELHRTAGIGPIEVIANGVPDLPVAMAPDDHRGPLRLAHIGGRTHYKGADLVEAALRYNHFANLHLLMIDGALASGECIETQWGESQVTLRGPMPQKNIALVYRDIDVLLAPSRWPESYGLVAREAAHFGRWVVASTIGAMGDDIVEGENGFRIDTHTRRALESLLSDFNADPDRYRQGSIKPVHSQRTTADQAKELAGIYRRIGRARSGAKR